MTSLSGAEPSEERLKQELPKHAFLHLATHGYFLADGLKSIVDLIAEQSERDRFLSDERHLVAAYFPSALRGLVCAGANELAAHPQPNRDNGLFTGEEIAGLDLSQCELAVLSACETGVGPKAFGAASGQGALSLARSFRDAGAKTVISSLWRVRDDSTRELMLDFYDRLWNKGESKLDALRNAQFAMLRKNREKMRRRHAAGDVGGVRADGGVGVATRRRRDRPPAGSTQALFLATTFRRFPSRSRQPGREGACCDVPRR
jgi:CHAT domain-containing protein